MTTMFNRFRAITDTHGGLAGLILGVVGGAFLLLALLIALFKGYSRSKTAPSVQPAQRQEEDIALTHENPLTASATEFDPVAE